MTNEGTRAHRVVETQFFTTALNLSIRACVIACLTLLFTGLYAFAQELGAVSQTKTEDYVAKFINTKGGVGNSQIYDTGTDVGVGTTTPGAKLDVNGTINAATGYNLGGTAFAYGSYTNGNAFSGFAGNSTMTGTANVAFGASALIANTSGDYNTAIGDSALQDNTAGHSTAAVGLLSLYQNTTGSYNAAIGNRSLEGNTTGGSNAAVGYQALYDNTTGSNNTGVGIFSGQTIDASAVTGSNTTALGSGAALGTGSISNATALGANAVVSVSNALVLGCIDGVNYCSGTVHVGIATSSPANLLTLGKGYGPAIADGWDTYSSRRWKTNIETLHGALAKVEQLRGVSYDLKANGKHEVGVIAEEVAAVVPEVVSFEDNGKDARGVDYSRLTALLIEATKEQQKQFRQQQADLSKALQQIKEQQNLLRAQSAAMRSLEGQMLDARESLRQVKAQVTPAPLTVVASK